MKRERIKAGFWSVHQKRMLDVHTPPFDWDERVHFLMSLAMGYQSGELQTPSPVLVIWTADDLSVSLLDDEVSGVPNGVLEAIEADVRKRGFKFPSSSKGFFH